MKVLRVIAAMLLVYVLSYVVLSVCGRYQPIAFGADHVEAWNWAPLGFYDPDHAWAGSFYAVHHPTEKTGGWHRAMMWAFVPLWELDCHYVHNGWPPEESNSLRKDTGQ
jgi:hypothetical protein